MRKRYVCVEKISLIGTEKTPGVMIPHGTRIRLYPHFKPAQNLPVRTGKGGHGGGDLLLLNDLLSPRPPRDKLMRAADYSDGAMSILVGIAANKSMKTGKPVRVDSLVQGAPRPRMAPMKD